MRKILTFSFASLLGMALLAATAIAQSQATAGQISGQVTDPNGAAVANATVKVTNKGTSVTSETTTTDEGLFTLVTLSPGTYTLTVEASGFATMTVEGVIVNVGRTQNVNVNLGAAGVEATVNVTSEAVQVTRNESDAVLNQTQISTLPINGRRFQDFVTLTPTAQVDPQRGQISLSGQKGINASINVDGVDYYQPFFGGIRGGERSNLAFTIPQESIKEFQVVANGYSAEFGRSTGGIVNAVTKSGDNDVRGTAFYLIRPARFARGNDFTERLQTQLVTRAPGVNATLAPTQHQFGGSAGGPFVKDKLFWFGAYEQQRFRAPRQILFTNFPPSGVTLNAAQQAVQSFYAAEQLAYTQTNDAYAGLVRIDWNVNTSNRFNVRLNASKNDALNAVSRGETSLDPTTNQSLSTNGTEQNKTKIGVAQLVSNFGPRTVNEFRFQYAREDRPRFSNSDLPQISTSFAIFGATAFLPTTQFDTRHQIADAVTFVTGNHTLKFGGEYSRLNTGQTFGFNQFGQYTLNIGTTATNIADALQRLGNAVVPQVGPPGTITPAILGRFDDTRARYNRQIGNLQAQFKSQQLAFFAQDSYRVTPTFTFNYGLRVEQQYNPEPEANNTQIINVVRNTIFPIRNSGYDATQIPDSGWQIGPRFGFAWDPEGQGKMVVRGFAGQYYATTPLLVFAGSVNNYRLPPGDVSTQLPFAGFSQTTFNTFLGTAAGTAYRTITGCDPAAPVDSDARNRCTPNTVYRQFAIIGINLNSSPLNGLPILTTQQIADIASRLGLNPNPFVGATVTGHAEDFKNPRSFQWGFAVEREMARNFVVGIDFANVITSRVQRNRDLNLPAPLTGEQYIAFLTANNTAARVATMAAPGGVFAQIRASGRTYVAIVTPAGLPFPAGTVSTRQRPTQAQQGFALGAVQVRESTAKALFRGWTVRARYNNKWLLVNAYYTLSRTFSDDDNERDAGGVAFADPYDMRREYWRARLDRENQFVANPIFFLPYGFEVSGALRLRSGVPVNANANGDLNGDNVFNDRPLLVPGVVFLRNAFRNRAIYDFDMRVQKSFKFGETRKLILSSEFFNLFNRMNIIFPNAGTNTTIAAGQFCSAASQLCGLDGGPPVASTFLRIQDANGNYINGATPGSPVFQIQLGARFQF